MDSMTMIKAQTTAAALKLITGYQPDISERPDGTALLSFRQADLPKIRAYLQSVALKSLKAAGQKQPVSIAFAPIVAPLAIKYIAPVAIAGAGALLLVGYMIGKR